MILYKNVDIIDLRSILEKGILSLDESGNNNWINIDKRAKNSTSKVYLFKPLSNKNTFIQYGTALLEISIDESLVKENPMMINDVNRDKYVEYITDRVASELIINIYIPELFKEKIEIPENILNRITWCGINANYYGKDGIKPCSKEILEKFANTAALNESSAFNYFRGTNEDNTMIDLYDIEYDYDINY